jgi:hypothetical protein
VNPIELSGACVTVLSVRIERMVRCDRKKWGGPGFGEFAFKPEMLLMLSLSRQGEAPEGQLYALA